MHMVMSLNPAMAWRSLMDGFYVLYFRTSDGLTGQPGTMTMRRCALVAQDETCIQLRPNPTGSQTLVID